MKLSELVNETMARKEIVNVVNTQYIAPNEATKSRLAIAFQKGRNVKSLLKQLERVEAYEKYETTSFDGSTIGDTISFVETRRSGSSCFSMTQKQGTIWALSGNTAIVTNGSKLKRVSLEK